MGHFCENGLHHLLAPNGLEQSQLFGDLQRALDVQADYVDLYFQHAYAESWNLEDSVVKRGSFGVTQGVGARAVAGERSALAFSDDLSIASVLRASQITREVIKSSGPQRMAVPLPRRSAEHATALYVADNPIQLASAAEKVALLSKVDELARARDARVKQVSAFLQGSYETVLILGSDGRLAADVRPLVNLTLTVVVESAGRRGTARGGGGGRTVYDFYTEGRVQHYVNGAVDAALLQLEAVDAPAGTMTVVCGSGWPGVLLHEAVGHGLEGDFNRKGSSVFGGRVGQRVAAKGVTILDNGALPGLRGSLSIDDEGNPGQSTTLIEDGILTGFMHDDLSARLLGVAPTGNGRRQSYAHEPLPRMTNTYMVNGEHEPEEIIRSVKRGIYAANFSGGQVDITSGRFTFAATQAYLIEDGRITAPVKGATLIGNGPESLKHVSMIGNDLALDEGTATCGKDGQSVPVGVGQPTLRIDSMTVGGSA
ncbi:MULTISPECIES: metalloprotease TldD [unclassified Pseudomonas]|uniref:metalloprotease TldD n=1 Tax=unclassified Pseudomonas TaxID=196821 RepID=UPI00382E66D8